MGYPQDVVRGAWSGISTIAALYTNGDWPFDGSIESWVVAVEAHRSGDAGSNWRPETTPVLPFRARLRPSHGRRNAHRMPAHRTDSSRRLDTGERRVWRE